MTDSSEGAPANKTPRFVRVTDRLGTYIGWTDEDGFHLERVEDDQFPPE